MAKKPTKNKSVRKRGGLSRANYVKGGRVSKVEGGIITYVGDAAYEYNPETGKAVRKKEFDKAATTTDASALKLEDNTEGVAAVDTTNNNFTDEEIKTAVTNRYGTGPLDEAQQAELAKYMQDYNVSPERMASIFNIDPEVARQSYTTALNNTGTTMRQDNEEDITEGDVIIDDGDNLNPDGGTADGGTADGGTPDGGTPDGGATDGGTSGRGEILKDYEKIDVASMVTKPEVATVDVAAGITADDAIVQLESFDNLTVPDKVNPQEMNLAVANVADAIKSGNVSASTYEAALADELNKTIAAKGYNVAPISVNELRSLSAPAQAQTVGSLAGTETQTANYTVSQNSFVPEVIAKGVTLAATPQIEARTREAITGTAASGEEAKILESINFEAAKRRAVTGTAAKGAAAQMVAEVGNIPPPVAEAIVEDPARVQAQIDNQPIEVQAAVAALPNEALVSSQLENLLGGMESGQVPMWARPAVAAVEQNMAQRGMSASTVARDALFNAIVQTAIPIAQSNAAALQQRASQNLSNEQQANAQTAQLDMQRRMANLANQQSAASQTAQFAQNMAQMQSQFRQDATMLSAQQAQEVRTQNLANRQRTAEINSQNQQAMNALNLSNEQQMELANLEALNAEGAQNLNAEQQGRLAEFQTAAEFMARNAGFTQEMSLANLSAEQQVRLANLTSLNQASSENLSAEQQAELTNLEATMRSNLAAADIAKTLNIAQLNANQQRAVQNASLVANIDLTKFNAEQQVALANSQFMQSVTMANFNAKQQAAMQNATAMASLDLATVDQRTKLAVTNAQAFLQMDMANLNNQQQANMLSAQMEQQRLLSNQSAENASRQFNATSENQTNQFMASLAANMTQFNTAQQNNMRQFNVQSQNAAAARDADRIADVNKANASILNQNAQFNAQLDFNRGQWNAANEQAVINSNVSWRRSSNLANTAAQNAVNQQNAQNAFGLTSSAQSFLWQELRDQADYDFRFAENSANRKLQAMIAAASSEGDAAKNWSTNFNNASATIDRLFGTG